jgi:hypothetical protein
MYRLAHQKTAICFALFASASLAAAADPGARPNRERAAGATGDLQPFTRTAYIPAGADLSSIRFESLKAVTVATTTTSTADRHYCETNTQEPGGSMYCPSLRDESPVPAYRVTYSYNGPSMASDEYGDTRFTFSVNLRPEDLSPAALQIMSGRKSGKAAAADYFALTTARGLVQQVAIDEANSALCDGYYNEGLWTHTNAGCEDKVTYKTVAVPSEYIAIRVDPVSSRSESLAADASGPSRQ